jgi:hypothetical protein
VGVSPLGAVPASFHSTSIQTKVETNLRTD